MAGCRWDLLLVNLKRIYVGRVNTPRSQIEKYTYVGPVDFALIT
jgi:hypothetical protein